MTQAISPALAPGGSDPPADPQDFSHAPERAVFAALDALGVAHATVRHAPTRTVEDSRLIKTDIPGGHTKNLFMKDKAGALVLISAWATSQLPLNQLHKAIGCQRLSFTDASLLWSALKVTPGSVSAFALIHDAPPKVRFILDAALERFEVLNFHPLRNDMTTSIPRVGLHALVAATGHQAETVDFVELGRGSSRPG